MGGYKFSLRWIAEQHAVYSVTHCLGTQCARSSRSDVDSSLWEEFSRDIKDVICNSVKFQNLSSLNLTYNLKEGIHAFKECVLSYQGIM